MIERADDPADLAEEIDKWIALATPRKPPRDERVNRPPERLEETDMSHELTDKIEARAFWQIIGERPIGATIVTTRNEAGQPNGFLGLSAAHISASPPKMLVSIDRKTSALADIVQTGRFALNFLPAEASDLAGAFGKSGPKPFETDDWDTLSTGAPALKTALGVMDCELSQIVEEDGVAIVIGRVVSARSASEGDALVFFRGAFERLKSHA